MRHFFFLALLTSCVSPLYGEWIQANGDGSPLDGMDDCPGDSCELDIFDLSKNKMKWLPTGEDPFPMSVDIEVAGRSPVLGGGARFVLTPDNPEDAERAGSDLEVKCQVLADQMLCDPATPPWIQRESQSFDMKPSGIYLRASGIYADDAL